MASPGVQSFLDGNKGANFNQILCDFVQAAKLTLFHETNGLLLTPKFLWTYTGANKGENDGRKNFDPNGSQ